MGRIEKLNVKIFLRVLQLPVEGQQVWCQVRLSPIMTGGDVDHWPEAQIQN